LLALRAGEAKFFRVACRKRLSAASFGMEERADFSAFLLPRASWVRAFFPVVQGKSKRLVRDTSSKHLCIAVFLSNRVYGSAGILRSIPEISPWTC
jgi:hypothetical protein